MAWWQRGVVWALVVILVLVALALTIGGALLIAEGGSPYYLLAGVAAGASAYGLVRGKALGIIAFGLLLIATIPWALLESGFDAWPLAPRLVAPAVLGLAFLLPAVRKAAGSASRWWVGAPVLVIALIIGVSAWLAGRNDGVLAPAKAIQAAMAADSGEWRNYGRSLGGDRYSPLAQIDAGNVGKLQQVWRYQFPISSLYFGAEATPLAADGRLYVCLDEDVVVALDQETGQQKWRFDPKFDTAYGTPTCRGVSYYQAPQPVADCPRRILYGVADGRLLALDADTGRPCPSFGQNGTVDLRTGMGDSPPGSVGPKSPPTIVRGIAVVGQEVTDYLGLEAPSGVIRGYDAVTGDLRWAWDLGRPDRTTLPPPGETYTRDTPNSWTIASADEALGLVFIPTGNAPPDYYGGRRTPQADSYASSIVALDVATGQPRWSFQTVHHDLWDYDIASQPVLVDIPTSGGMVPALIAPTKRAQLFVLDRRTGQPIDRVVEKAVPQGAGKGDWTSKTQPYTMGFPSLAGPDFTEARMWGLTPLDQLWCRVKFHKLRYEGQFTPPFSGRTLAYPGSGGGSNWGSVTIDRDRMLLIANTLHVADVGNPIPFEEAAGVDQTEFKRTLLFKQNIMPRAYKRQAFISPLGVPCQQPPFGTLSVFDLKTRSLLWSKPFGTAERSGPLDIPTLLPLRIGVPNFGGSVATAGGIFFIGATQDRHFRAFDTANGRELWRASLPIAGAATPMTYVSPKSGRQFVAIVAGGHPAFPGSSGGSIVAFALPR